jgi:hypothetical protein
MTFVRYNGLVGIIARNGQELVAENPASGLSDHLGVWFGEVDDTGHPIVCAIPAEYIKAAEVVPAAYQH